MDLLWFAKENTLPVNEVAQVMGLSEIQIQRLFSKTYCVSSAPQNTYVCRL